MDKYLSNKKALAMFILPLLIIYVAIIVYPAVQTLLMSFTQWDGLNNAIFVGFNNFIRMFKSRDLKVAVLNGLKYPLVVASYQIVIGTLLANLLSSDKLKGKKFFRTTYFIPVVLSITVVCQLWISIYHSEFGLLNTLFERMGTDYRQYWLSQKNTVIFAVAFVDAWKGMGYQFVLIYAGLKSIPETYFEAARIDGASAWQRFRFVTLPLMAPTYKVALTLTLTWGFRTFQSVNIMTSGGPGNASYTMPVMIYKGIYQLNNYGYASSTAVILLIQCLIVLFLLERAFKNTIAG